MKLNELLESIEIIETNAKPDLEISGVSYDSRNTEAGDVFVAIAGFESDGHRFIPMALEKGAAAVICTKKPETDCAYVLVGDSRHALAIASKNFVIA